MKHNTLYFFLILFTTLVYSSQAQEYLFDFGEVIPLANALEETDKGKTEPIQWYNVNTEKETWDHRDSILVCYGNPIGVVRSGRQFENYMLHVEWKHMEAGGNSGMFMWSSAVPGKNRLPNGVEVQMLELDWVKLNTRNGKEPPIAYVHGEMWGVGDVVTTPDNPRGVRSKSIENRCKGKGEWNTYDVVCVDGTIKLSVNGKFVNGISESTQRKGYMCLESEGAEIHFRNLKVIELPGGLAEEVESLPNE
ncbi:DUF1080 domain-containing protein [Membranicola marinus]|uniref:DUF1080 domain-containing protein n=1 Tax=Membranihabitans marinus TaxID=1227546 RepID=A0A953HLJ0_9BACT|nr:DUF1080 domain-containing protein [Membranihabitans marinus]MBY5958164.1 DUF1080 domain-containing protein [Membranihabitans marinus]